MAKPNLKLLLSQGQSQQTSKTLKLTLKRNSKKKKFWTETEDRILQKAVQKYGSKRWSQISKLLKNRHPKRCRERWFNYLCQAKQEWKTSDLWMLYLAYRNYGNKWSQISKILGRGDNIVKNKVTCFKRNGMDKFQQKQFSLQKRLNDLRNDVKMLQALPQIQRKFVINLLEEQELAENRARVQDQTQKAQQNQKLMQNQIRTRQSQEQNPFSISQYANSIEIFHWIPQYSQLFIPYYIVWNGYRN